jgi:hypothetical protein
MERHVLGTSDVEEYRRSLEAVLAVGSTEAGGDR